MEISGFVDGVLITIYDRAVKDEKASESSDVPKYTSQLYIKKKVPNSRDEYDQPFKPTDREKYPELIDAFEQGEKIPLNGIPLDQWPALDVTQVQTLKSAHIFTVQSVAELAETGFHRLPPGYANLKVKAQKWLNQGRELEALQKKNADLLKRVEALEKLGKEIDSEKKGKKVA